MLKDAFDDQQVDLATHEHTSSIYVISIIQMMDIRLRLIKMYLVL